MDATAPQSKARALARRMLSRLAPPPQMSLSEWAEAEVILPASQTFRPGHFRNWPYMREILDSIADPEIEQVTLQKGVRIGFTTSLVVGIAARVVTDPCPIGYLLPTDDDARRVAVKDVEPLFQATPAVAELIIEDRIAGRNTMMRKTFKGGAALTFLSARAARNLRSHTFKVLYADEIDAMQVTPEGDPLLLAEKRTLTYPDRKMVWGSTPIEEGISNVERKYHESDQRVFEVACPHCGEFFELKWPHIKFDSETVERTEEAFAICPANGCVIDEGRDKLGMVEGGRWRATRPEVARHHGYRLNALVSLLTNASWGKLASEFLKAKRGGPSELQVFINTILAETWKTSLNRLDGDTLRDRAERFGLAAIPAPVLMLTVGADVQDDRIEATILGWPREGSPYVLAHHSIDGNTLDDATWDRFDGWLKRRYQHPHGWGMDIDACAIDSGGHEGRTQKVYDFAGSRYRRRIFAIKGAAGARPIWARAQKVKKFARLFIVGHDQVKTEVMERLAREPFDDEGKQDIHAIRISEDVPDDWYDQVTGEVRRMRYVRNRPVIEFMPKKSGQRVEALDALCYGWAVRFSPSIKSLDLDERAARAPVKGERPKRKGVGDWAAALNR